MAPLRLPAWSAPSWLRQHSANEEENEDLPSEAAQPCALRTRKSDARLMPRTLSLFWGEARPPNGTRGVSPGGAGGRARPSQC